MGCSFDSRQFYNFLDGLCVRDPFLIITAVKILNHDLNFLSKETYGVNRFSIDFLYT